MIEAPHPNSPKPARTLGEEVGAKAERKLRAGRDAAHGVWFGLGMMGLVGWSVTIPTILGAGLGIWLDQHFPGKHAWTLALLVAGLAVGCFNAWHWVSKEGNAIQDDQGDGDA